MTYYNRPQEDDDLDVEFSDLPLEGEPTPVEKLILRGIALVSVVRGTATWQSGRLARLSQQVRDWLLTKPSSQRFADGSTSDDIELEVNDLPAALPTRTAYLERAALIFLSPGTRFSFKMRLWRVVVVLCTIILAFALIFSTVPQVRGWLSGLLARPAVGPSSVSTSNTITSESSAQIIIEPDSTTVSGTPVVTWSVDATPGPAPQGQDCSSRPLMRRAAQLGDAPVWVRGFDGQRATLHFDPDPAFAPVFPNSYGWTASLTVEVQGNYTRPITLSGGNLGDGSYIFFAYYLNQDKQSSSIILNSSDTLVPPTLSSTYFGQTLTWHVELYFASAGCYALQARWASGSWTVVFSAGR